MTADPQRADDDNDVNDGNDAVPTRALRFAPADLAEALGRLEYFSTPAGVPYAQVPVGDGTETHPLDSAELQDLVSLSVFEATRRPLSDHTWKQQLPILRRRASQGPTREVHLRTAEHLGTIFYDLADEEGRVVQINARGWSVTTECPVSFRRPAGMRSAPEPMRGGGLDLLRPLLNIPESLLPLVQAWLVWSVMPADAYPCLMLTGPQGTAKTTSARMLKAIADPGASGEMRLPRSEDDLFVVAGSTHVLSFGNVSSVSPLQSDALCSIATGGAWGKRQLFTDSSVSTTDVCRPMILNGIGAYATRSDLLDRSILLELPVLAERRQDDRRLRRTFEDSHALILGAVFDAMSMVLADRAQERAAPQDRMSGFVLAGQAMAPSLGLTASEFTDTFRTSQRNANLGAILDDPVAAAVWEVADEPGVEWIGTASDLRLVAERVALHRTGSHHGVPRNASAVSRHLHRIEPNLRHLGITVEHDRTGSQRIVHIRNLGTPNTAEDAQAPSFPSLPSPRSSERPPTDICTTTRTPQDLPELPPLGPGQIARYPPGHPWHGEG